MLCDLCGLKINYQPQRSQSTQRGKTLGQFMRIGAFLFGIVFLALGIAGWTAADGYLLSALKINGWLTALYLITGLTACVVGFLKRHWALLYFQILGIAYALLAIMGFVYGEQDILGLFASSIPNAWLHVIAATNALILGYGSNH